MKNLLVILSIALSTSVMGNTVESVFKSNTQISLELQKRILNSINEQCVSVVSSFGLSEINTSTRNEKIDQGIIDVFHTTTFSSRYYFDGMHPTTTYITVESAEYSFQNGDNLEVIKVSCN